MQRWRRRGLRAEPWSLLILEPGRDGEASDGNGERVARRRGAQTVWSHGTQEGEVSCIQGCWGCHTEEHRSVCRIWQHGSHPLPRWARLGWLKSEQKERGRGVITEGSLRWAVTKSRWWSCGWRGMWVQGGPFIFKDRRWQSVWIVMEMI